jgi:hypothetical protein
MQAFQSSSADAATDALFGQALSLLQISGMDAIQKDYQRFERDWESHGLCQDSRDELYNRVLSNLRKTSSQPGFHYFLVRLDPQNHRAEVFTFTDGEGTSVLMWRTRDSLYLCGNRYFE